MPVEVTTSMLGTAGLIKGHGPHRILETASIGGPHLYGPSASPRGASEGRPEDQPSAHGQSRRVTDLIGAWLADESGHDEHFWPIFERDLAEAD